jgi:REP element-mobilizing transposase RayT
MSRKKHIQLTLDRARRPDGRHGGWRPGAGRPRKPGAISHATRAYLASRFPQHVTLRIRDGVPGIAGEWLMKIIRGAILQSHKIDFRVAEFNVLGNHIHLITEALDKDNLARGMNGLEVRLARRLNRALKRRGKLFAYRYHARYLTTPRQVRNALRYVLLNRKHHAAEKQFSKYWIDTCSSAPWFARWAEALRYTSRLVDQLVAGERPTAEPETWLLAVGWKRHGPLSFDERPA